MAIRPISGLIGGLLAAGHPGTSWLFLALALLGLVAAHAANNMIYPPYPLEAR